MYWRRSRLLGITLTSALAVSCSKGSSTSTEGQQKKPAFAAEERSVGDIDGGTPQQVGASKKVKLAANKKIGAEFKSRVSDALQRGKGFDLLIEIKGAATQAQKGLRQTTTAAQAMKNARAAIVQNLGNGAQVTREFGTLPFVMVHVNTLAAFQGLLAHGDVARIHENQELKPLATLDSVVGRTAAATAINNGGVGNLGAYNSGTQTPVNIVLLDGMVDTAAAGLSTAVVTPSGLVDSNSAHATALAGAIHAMAPGAHIYNDVITTGGVADTSSLLAGLGHVSSINASHPVSAVVIAFGSLNAYSNALDCEATGNDGSAFSTAINNLRSLGIVTFAAAGNSANLTSMPAPACMANVVSVGATQGPNTTSTDYLSTGSTTTCLQSSVDKDARLCNSNSAAETDLLAPGLYYQCGAGGAACTQDTDCGGAVGSCKVVFHCDGNGTVGNTTPATFVPNTTSCTSSVSCGNGGKCIPSSPYGTSIAAANAAAAYAITRGFGLGQSPNEGAERALSRLTASGNFLTDPRNGNNVTPRIQLDAAVADCVGPVPNKATLSFDLTGAPTQTVTIDSDPGCGAGTQCNGGPTPGADCQLDADCKRPDGICDFRCIGGATPGSSCTSSSNCTGISNGFCAGLTCTGGANNGGPCTMANEVTDCAGSTGTCDQDTFDAVNGVPGQDGVMDTCTGGTNGACVSNGDCTVNAGTCGGAGNCSGGANPGVTCSDDTFCTGVAAGTCQTSSTCVGGDNPGIACSSNTVCVGTGDCSASIQMDSWITATVNNSTRTATVGALANNAGERVGQVSLYGASVAVDQTGDTTAPSAGTLTITVPAAPLQPISLSGKNWISTGTVTLNSTATGTPTEMCFSNLAAHCDLTSTSGTSGGHTCTGGSLNLGADCNADADCLATECDGTWVAYAAAKANYALAAGSGDKTVEAWYRDAAGNVSTGVTASVSVDGTAPANGTLTSVLNTSGTPRFDLTLTNTSDAGAGIPSSNNIKVVVASSASGTPVTPANCGGGTIVTGTVSGSSITWSDPATLTAGTTYVYRVCVIDALGNTSTGAASQPIRVVTDSIVPAGTLSLTGTGGVSGYSTTTAVSGSITMTSSDDSGGTPRSVSVCISKLGLDGTATCPTTAEAGGWQAVTATTWATPAITLATGDAVKTYSYKFKDASLPTANISAVKTTTIKLDATAPKAGTVSGTTLANYDAKISWASFSDAGYPIARYDVWASALNGAAPTCGTGTRIYTGALTTYTDTGINSAGTRSYTVCAYDGVGRPVSASVSGVALKLEITPPVIGTVTVLPTCNSTTLCYGTAKFTKDTTPAIAVTVNDANLLGGSLCFSTTSTTTGCTWQAVTSVAGTTSTATYAPSKALLAGSSTQNYYLFAKDKIGNVSAAKTVPVKMDTIAPTFSAVSLTKLTTTSVKLAWTVSDGTAGSGLATSAPYYVRYAMGTATAAPTATFTCTTGGSTLTTGFFTGTTATTNVPAANNLQKTALTTNRYYTFIVCAKDNLGTVSAVQKRTLLLK